MLILDGKDVFMETIVHLNISSKEFFEAIYKSIISDVKDSINKTITRKDIVDGFSYDKVLKTRGKKDRDAKVIISEFIVNEKFTTKYISKNGTNIVTYEIVNEDSNGVDIKYSEEFESEQAFKVSSFNLVNKLFKNANKKRVTNSLLTIENYIIQTRKQK